MPRHVRVSVVRFFSNCCVRPFVGPRERIGFTLLADEKFDFDISLSPKSAKEDDDCDEVFIGPVSHKEKCVSAALEGQELEEKTPPQNIEQGVWSPLSGEKFVEIFKEAHLLALQLECFASGDHKKEEPPQTVQKPAVENFLQESKTKLNLFDTFNEVNKTPVAIKRETYCIQDSPFHQLPPSVQQRFAELKTGGDNKSALESQNCANPLKVPKLVKSHLVSPHLQKAKTKPVKSNAPLPNTGKTVSKPQILKAPAMYMKNTRLTVEKPKGAKKMSPNGRINVSSMGSTEDLLSDKSSVASDISDSSFNSSIVSQSKRTLPVPNKLGLQKMQFKTPAASAAVRKNTTSSSSSQSSLNSSITVSPPAANAKLNSSLNTSLNTSVTSSRLKPSTSRLALVHPLGISASLKSTSTELPNNQLKPSTSTKINGNKSTSVSVAEPQTKAGKFQRQSSAPNLQRLHLPSKPGSVVKGLGTKPQAKVMPTPTNKLKPPQRQEGFSPDRVIGKPMKPTRLLSCGEIESGIVQSTPIGSTKGMLPNSSLTGRGISSTPSSKHVSGLPTPLSRRTSGITTPRTIPRSISSLRPTSVLQASIKSTTKPLVRPAEFVETKTKVPPSSPCEADSAVSAICCSLNFSPENKTVSVAQSEKQQSKSDSLQSEVLLIDIEVESADAKVRKPSSSGNDSQPLIDLSNTPEVNKRLVPLKPAYVGQLIDLSSPLIKLSPAMNKENVELDYPLLQF
ncbi:G2 and S phase-expressed protein 1 isoform X2 [Pseudophryne corroboree]|uniref:G2 and S phase-expressed protein 1 isoform X2 n=1 Tax=Pseudophryne corroboree TaxID=495146 RepID=UPI0030819E8C